MFLHNQDTRTTGLNQDTTGAGAGAGDATLLLGLDGLDRSAAEDVLATADLMAVDLTRAAVLRFADLVGAAVGGAR